MSAQPNLYRASVNHDNSDDVEKPVVALISDWPSTYLASRFAERGMGVNNISAAQALHNVNRLNDVSAIVFCITKASEHLNLGNYQRLLEKLSGKYARKQLLVSAYLTHPVKGTHLLFDLIQLSRLCSNCNMVWLPPTELGCMSRGSDTTLYVKNIYSSVKQWYNGSTF